MQAIVEVISSATGSTSISLMPGSVAMQLFAY